MKIPGDKNDSVTGALLTGKKVAAQNSDSVKNKDTEKSTQTGSSREALFQAAAKINVESSLGDYDAESIDKERADLVANLKSLVASGNYFKSRDIKDIAMSVSKGLDDEVDMLKFFE